MDQKSVSIFQMYSPRATESSPPISGRCLDNISTICAPFFVAPLIHNRLGRVLGIRDDLPLKNDSKAVFITYIVSASVCYCIYALSNTLLSVQTVEKRQEEVELTETLPSPNRYGAHANPSYMESQRRHDPKSSISRSSTGGEEMGQSTDLAQAIRDAARLRRELAFLDTHIADLLEAHLTPIHDARAGRL